MPLSSEGLTSLTLMALGLGGLEAVNLSIMLHLGTSIAAIIYFHRDLSRDFMGDKRILRVLLIATPLTSLTALPLFGVLREASSLGVLLQLLIGFSLISTGLLMRGVKHRGEENADSMGDGGPWSCSGSRRHPRGLKVWDNPNLPPIQRPRTLAGLQLGVYAGHTFRTDRPHRSHNPRSQPLLQLSASPRPHLILRRSSTLHRSPP